jgi:hypothetical protein
VGFEMKNDFTVSRKGRKVKYFFSRLKVFVFRPLSEKQKQMIKNVNLD